MKRLYLMLLFFPLLGLTQEKGTHFEHGLSFQQLKEKAKKENKYLFVDCFTTWCVPCRMMAADVFPQEKVGTFFNKNFVSVKVQFDKTKDDREEVRSWYADAEAIAKEFNVKNYPTFLIFSPQGELVHRILGANPPDIFIAKAQNALNPETQYHTLLRKYESGNFTAQDLKNLAAVALNDAIDEATASKFFTAYLATQTNLFSKENLDFIAKSIKRSKDEGFNLIKNNPEKVDAVLGKGKAFEILSVIILREEIYPGLGKPTSNVDSLIAAAKVKYPTVDITKATELLKVQLYQGARNWNKFQPSLIAYMKKYDGDVNVDILNAFIWTFIDNCKDTDCLTSALEWSKRNVEVTKEEVPRFLYTHANMLYKLGKKKDAILILQKAIDLAEDDFNVNYQATLDKMKNDIR